MRKLLKFIHTCYEIWWLVVIANTVIGILEKWMLKNRTKPAKPANPQKALFESGDDLLRKEREKNAQTKAFYDNYPKIEPFSIAPQVATPISTGERGKQLMLESFSPEEREQFMAAEPTSSAKELTKECMKQFDKLMRVFEKKEEDKIRSEEDF
jgi:hypothetical protein